MKRGYVVGGIGLLLVAGATAWFEPGGRLRGWLAGEPFFHGRPAHYWAGQLRDADPVALSAALAELRDGSDELFPVLAQLIQEAPADAPEVRWRAASLIGEYGDRAHLTVPTLLEAIYDTDPAVQAVAVRTLGKVAASDPVVVARLTELLDGPLALEALAALTHSGPAATSATTPIVLVLKTDAHAACRVLAAEALGGIGSGDRPVVEALQGALGDEDAVVRQRAAEALGRLRRPGAEVLPSLINVLKDPESRVQQAAAIVLGRMGPAGAPAVAALRPLLSHPDPAVRRAAAGALRRIEGRPAD